jgi:hypothetical protein
VEGGGGEGVWGGWVSWGEFEIGPWEGFVGRC